MAISLAFSIVLYRGATSEFNRGFHGETDRISRQFPIFQGNPMLRPGPEVESASHRLLVRLVGFNIIVLIGAGLSSYWLARRTLRPIEEAHEHQKRFTADVSHELRTPLTALRMESEVALMNQKSSAKDLRQTIASNLEEVTKLEALINNLLRLSHLEADELRQNFTALSSRTVVETALKQIQPLAEDRHISLESKLQDLPLNGDLNSLVQLLVIVLDNAIKYSPARSAVAVQVTGKNSQVIITIGDHGQGIDPEALAYVFDRFYRADKSRTRTKAAAARTQGYGLGLSIAKMIADLHNATINLSSRVGHGTTATITLPLAETAKA